MKSNSDMRVLGLSGSPRRAGNSETLLDAVLDGAACRGANIEKVVLAQMNYAPCLGCHSCENTAICRQKDDMYVIYRKVRLADCIVIASPIYFGHVTAQLKAMIDRFEVAWSDKYITDARRVPEPRSKQGIFICVSAEPKREYFNNAQKTVRFFFNTIGVDYKHGLWCPGLERAGDVTGKKHLIDKALRLGQRIVPKRKRRN